MSCQAYIKTKSNSNANVKEVLMQIPTVLVLYEYFVEWNMNIRVLLNDRPS